jgi:hypothetical protein
MNATRNGRPSPARRRRAALALFDAWEGAA